MNEFATKSQKHKKILLSDSGAERRNQILIFLSILLLVALNSCNPYQQDSYQKHYVVEAYLAANRDLPPVEVSKTLPAGEAYSFKKAALDDASVSIQRLDSNGVAAKTYTYYRKYPGTYTPKNPEPVLPEHRYRLMVAFPNGDSVTARTLVPGAFHPVGPVPDSSVYKARQIAVTITPSYYPGRQSYYIFTVNAVNPKESRLTPFYTNLVSNEDTTISDFYINSSGIINQKNYDQNPDGTLTIKLPWLAVAFYGKNKIVANAIDDNLYDFARTQSAQTGGSSLPPGQIQNIRYHVKGGIGIFGSMASDTISVFIKKEKGGGG